MAYFISASIEANEDGATNPSTGEVFDRFVLVRFPTGERTELHDDGIIGFVPLDPNAAVQIEAAIKIDPITLALRAGETVDILLRTVVLTPHIGPALPTGWPLHMDLSGADDARLACRIVDPLWRAPAPSVLPFRAAYPTLYAKAHILVESDCGRFIATPSFGWGNRHRTDAELRAGEYLWWTGYQRFAPDAFL